MDFNLLTWRLIITNFLLRSSISLDSANLGFKAASSECLLSQLSGNVQDVRKRCTSESFHTYPCWADTSSCAIQAWQAYSWVKKHRDIWRIQNNVITNTSTMITKLLLLLFCRSVVQNISVYLSVYLSIYLPTYLSLPLPLPLPRA